MYLRSSSLRGKTQLPVFFDPTSRRWVALKVISGLSFFSALGLLAVVVLRVLAGPDIGGLSMLASEARIVVQQPDTLVTADVDPVPVLEKQGGVADASAFFLPPSPVRPGDPVTGSIP